MKKLLLTVLVAGSVLTTTAATPLKINERPAATRVSTPASTGIKIKSTDRGNLKMRAAAKAAAEGPITEAPAGEVKTYARGGFGVYSLGFYPTTGSDEGFVTDVVWCEDGSVYIKNPLMFMPTDTYMKGRVEGNELVFDLPQQISHTTEDDPSDPNAEYVDMYLTMLTGAEDEFGDIEFTPAEGACELRYTITDGSFGRELDLTDFTMLGLVWDGYFMDYGELSCEYTPFSAEAMEAPTGITTEPWACTYNGDGHYVQVGFDNSEVYIQGIAPAMPDAWIKGSLENGKVILPSGQFIGVNESNHYLAYFYGATMSLEIDPEWGDLVMTPHFADNLTLDYNAAEKIMSSEDAALINASTTKVYYQNLLDKPVIRIAPENSDYIPCNAEILNFMPASVFGTGALQFDLPRTSTDGAILDTDKMYYNVFYDGVLTELIEGMPDIPWNYTDGWDFSVYGITHEAYYYDSSVQTVGIQNCFVDGDKVSKSDIVYTDGTVVGEQNGINSPVCTSVSGVTYTDLLGRKTTDSSKGITIKTTTYSDGSVKTEKIIIR